MINDENIETLMDFGLSYVQSLTYLTLVKLKKADAKTIARMSSVARQDIYRIMPALQELGLVEKILGVPTLYRARPIKSVVSFLLENKKGEYERLIGQTDMLINTFPKSDEKVSLGGDDTQFTIISELSLLLKLHEKLTLECQNTLDIMMPLCRYSKKVEEQWCRVHEVFIQKTEVKIRLITKRPKDQKAYFMFWKPLLKNPMFEVKYVNEPIYLYMHIFDNKQCTLSVGKYDILPSLWSNNPNVVQLAITNFNSAW